VPDHNQSAAPPVEPVRAEEARTDRTESSRLAGVPLYPPNGGYRQALGVAEQVNVVQDRVRWGPVWAGFFTALTTLLLLGLLGVAVGLTTNAGLAAARGAPPPETGMGALLWGVASAVIAFLLGGFVAGRSAANFSRGWGAFNGAMVFLLGLPLVLWLATQGLSSVLGTLGQFSAAAAAPNPVDQAAQATSSLSPSEIAQAAIAVRNGAWGALIVALLALVASVLGGIWGTRQLVVLNEEQGVVER
jgi:hypothetical protein